MHRPRGHGFCQRGSVRPSTLRNGHGYVQPARIALNVLTTDSRLVRLLQAADLVTGATFAYVSGESTWSPGVVGRLRDLFPSELGRVGGVGVKLHPDYVYANLYHWIFGDTVYVRYPLGHPYPLEERPFAAGPDEY